MSDPNPRDHSRAPLTPGSRPSWARAMQKQDSEPFAPFFPRQVRIESHSHETYYHDLFGLI